MDRGQTLQLRFMPYADLARVAGAFVSQKAPRRIVPGATVTAVVTATLTVSNLILAEAALSFLGKGAPAPTPA